nr:hypothetical protein [uncultured Emticicia sp.]
MLPEQLNKLKDSLIKKGSTTRSTVEDKLLDELVFLDKNITINEPIEKGGLTENFKSYGGTATCPNCGKRL